MKKIISLSLLFLTMVSCEAAKPAPNTPEALQKKVDSLATEIADLKSVLNFTIEKVMRSSFDNVKLEMEKASKIWDLQIEGSPSIGNPKAKIVIVEFTEFECPYCARIAPYLDSLVRTYPDKIRLVYKHFPLTFHTNAPAAAAASIAAQKQGKFWEYRWELAPHFRNLNEETFISVAQKVGIKNIEQFKKDMVLDKEIQAIIDRDTKLGMEVGVQGTPNFYVNGKRQDMFSPALVDQLLKDLY